MTSPSPDPADELGRDAPNCEYCGAPLSPEEAAEGLILCESCGHKLDFKPLDESPLP